MNARVAHYTYDREILEYVTNAWIEINPPPPERAVDVTYSSTCLMVLG